MNRIVIFLFSVIFFLPLTVHGGNSTLITESYNRFKPAHIKSDQTGNIWIAYHDLEGKIRLRNANTNLEFLIGENIGDIAGGLVLDVKGEKIYIAWREKIGAIKNVLFRVFNSREKILSEPIILDSAETEALTRIKIASNNKGDVHVLWYGERLVGQERYHLYCASSNDFGKSFSAPQNLTLGYGRSIYPTIMADEDSAYVFSYSNRQGKIYMIFKKTLDGGKTWSEPVEIKEIGVVTLFIEPFKVKERLHVFWLNSYDEEIVVEGAYSDDKGKTWKTYFLEDTRGLDIGLLKTAYDSEGNIYISLSGKKEGTLKTGVYLLNSNDNGQTWKKIFNLRRYPYDLTKAEDSQIIAPDSGSVAVVWVDYRNIRSNIYMQFSMDGGRTWQENDIPLEDPGLFNTRYFPFANNLIKDNDRLYLLSYRFKSDLTTAGKSDLLLIDFKLDKGVQK